MLNVININLTKLEFGLSRWGKSEVKIEGGLLGLMAVGNQATENIDYERAFEKSDS
jgi:hypothetical protein